MNYLRSTVALAASASLVALVAGCSTESADVSNGDVAPSTEVQSKGLEPLYTPPPATICPQDVGYSDKDAAFFQVQASRVAKYLFGGNDPFTGTSDSESPEYGSWGEKYPDMTNDECRKASEIIHAVHDKLYPPSPEKCDQKQMIRTKQGYVCPPPVPSASVASGPLTTACNLPADSFGFSVQPSDPLWGDMEYAAILLDGCWGKGISGFMWVKTGVAITTGGSGSKGDDQEREIVNIMGVDPEPADLKDPLSGSTGATAAAVYKNTGVATKVVLWPSYFTSGGYYPAGTPCSNWGLAPGSTTTKQIVLNATGTQRKCI